MVVKLTVVAWTLGHLPRGPETPPAALENPAVAWYAPSGEFTPETKIGEAPRQCDSDSSIRER
jgi:hypothetical protein